MTTSFSSSFTFYADYLQGQTNPAPVIECPPRFGEDAWIHGTFDNQINQSWLGMVGPGVRHLGLQRPDRERPRRHRPDDAVGDGPSSTPVTTRGAGCCSRSWATPHCLRASTTRGACSHGSGEVYKQIHAPAGQLGNDSLRYSTAGIVSGGSPGDELYRRTEATLRQITSRRDALAGQIAAALNGAAFSGKSVDPDAAEAQTSAATRLLERVHDLAGSE